MHLDKKVLTNYSKGYTITSTVMQTHKKKRGENEMPCVNLKGEMAKKDITIEKLSKLLGIHRNSVANKINGDSQFSIDEAIKIQETYFPKLALNYLFEKEDIEEPDAEKTK